MSTDQPPSFLFRLEKRMHLFAGVGLVLVSGVLFLCASAGGSGTVSREACTVGGEEARRETRTAPSELGKLTFVTGTGRHDFVVEMKSRPCDLAEDMMFRRRLGLDRGMVFEYPREQIGSLWIKDSDMPLDMVFVANWKVVSAASNSEPTLEDYIVTSALDSRVVAVSAGTVARIGLRPGDAVALVPFIE